MSESTNTQRRRSERVLLALPVVVRGVDLLGQPFEDHNLGGGVSILDAALESIERAGEGFRVRLRRTDGEEQWRNEDAVRLLAANKKAGNSSNPSRMRRSVVSGALEW